MFDDEVDNENKSKEGGFKIDIGGSEESHKNHEFFTGMNLKTPDFKNKKALTIGFMCVICFYFSSYVFSFTKVKKENLKNFSTVSTASPAALDKQHIRDSIKSLQPYKDKLMKNL